MAGFTGEAGQSRSSDLKIRSLVELRLGDSAKRRYSGIKGFAAGANSG